jgi:YgiT-type zinc finger domain-containing protein
MKCVICKSPNIQKKTVEEEFRVGNDMVFIPVETLVCIDCGERYYDRKTMRCLETIESELKENKIPLEVVGRVLKKVGRGSPD